MDGMNGIPHDKGEQRCQAVGGNAEGKVPTTAPDCASESREGIRPPGSDAACESKRAAGVALKPSNEEPRKSLNE